MDEEIIVFSDVHFAKIWDDVDRIIGNKLGMLNPNKELKKIVKKINNSPNVVAVVNNGDSVDYFFSDYFKNKFIHNHPNNWDLFNGIVSKIERPYFEIPGNHDYRRLPYNLNFWGMDHLNVPGIVWKKFENLIGHTKFRWLDEISSISVNENNFDPLKKFNGLKEPIEKKLGSFHCVFLNTGSDAFVRLNNFLKYFKKMMVSGSFKKIMSQKYWQHDFSCDSDGFNQKDLMFVEKVLNGNCGELYFFMHTPIINPKKSNVGHEYILNAKNLSNSIIKNKIAHGVILNGVETFLEKLFDFNYHKNNFIIIASHIHNAKYFLIHKESLVTKEVTIEEFNKEKGNPIFTKHLTTLSLGAIDHFDKNKKVGYLKITKHEFKEIISKRF